MIKFKEIMGSLQEVNKAKINDFDFFMNGNCDAFAIALKLKFNYTLGVLINDKYSWTDLIHAFAIKGDVVIDYAGVRPLKQLIKPLVTKQNTAKWLNTLTLVVDDKKANQYINKLGLKNKQAIQHAKKIINEQPLFYKA